MSQIDNLERLAALAGENHFLVLEKSLQSEKEYYTFFEPDWLNLLRKGGRGKRAASLTTKKSIRSNYESIRYIRRTKYL